MFDLFKIYGFEYISDYSNNLVSVFTINQGGFSNSYIVSTDNEESKKTEEQLIELGYSVRRINSSSYEKIHNVLFSSFFGKKSTKIKLQKEYERYAKRVALSYLANEDDYKYISSPYIFNGKASDQPIVVDRVLDLLDNPGPEFIIIEAAAGFGKTSTAFEICSRLAQDQNKPIAILAELSRDRKAKTFRHILLEQIDRMFPSLSSSLVESEIKNGNLIIILDGFDELLRGKKEDADFEQSEAMLETISKLLELNAKIILTTRKTAILDSEGFYNWNYRHENKFRITRIEIEQPRISNWLSTKRIQKLINSDVDSNTFSSPVILSYLSFIEEKTFDLVSNEPRLIQETYFKSLLNREQKRQNLRMSVEEQHALFTRLAADMVHRNYTKDYRSDIVSYFTSNEFLFLQDVRSRYSPEEKKDIEDIAHTLSNHALLDRNSEDDRIGFINDFVFGYYVGRSIVSFKDQEWAGDELFIEVAVQSFSSQFDCEKEMLWKKLTWVSQLVSDQYRMSIQSRLIKKIEGDYSGTSINDMHFENIELLKTGKLKDSIICNCTFVNVTFYVNNISNCSFVDCKFFDCIIIPHHGTQSPSKFFGGCDDNCGIVDALGSKAINSDYQDDDNKVARFIFSKFWPAGKDSITFAHRPLSLFFSKVDDEINPEAVADAITKLKREGFILDANKKSWIGINTNKLGEISTILGK